MGEVIRDWITEKLGIIIDLYNVTFSSKAQDGVLLASILKSCGVISKDQFQFIKKTTDPEIAFENYNRYIRIWLKDLNIQISECEIREIANGEGNAALNLFYKVYLKSIHRNILEYETIRKCKEVKQPGNSRFKVTRTIEPKVGEIQPINSMVAKNWDILSWNKDKIFTLSKKISQKKVEYIEYLRSKSIHNTDQKVLAIKLTTAYPVTKTTNDDLIDFPDEPELNYDDLIKEQIMVNKMPQANNNTPQLIRNSRKLFNNYNKKKKVLLTLSYDQKELSNKDALQYLRDILEADQNKEFENYLNLKCTQNSLFEQECITLLCEIRNRKKNLITSKRIVNQQHENDLETERDTVMLLQSKQIEDEENNYYFERDRLNELYDRISETEEMYIKNETFQMCSTLVEDLIDYVESISVLNENFTWPVLIDYMQETHKLLFLKCETIPTIYWPFEDILFYDPKCNDELNLMYAKEIRRQNVLNDVEFANYFNIEGTFKEINERIPCENSHLLNTITNILGYIVHTLLLYKYPIKKPYSNPNIKKPLITACVNGIYDFTVLPTLKLLLKSKEIKIIQVQDVINYCIETYKSILRKCNLNITEDEENKFQNEKPLETNISFINSCIPQLNKTNESLDSMSNSFKTGISKPSRYVQAENRIEFSETEILGKNAYEILTAGKCLSNYQITSMVVEYLKSLKNIKGWVLINFPENYEQAMLLEALLSGTKLPDMESYLFDRNCDIDYLNITNKNQNIIDMKVLRKNKVLPRTIPDEKMPKFTTFLSSYINISQTPVDTFLGGAGLPPIKKEIDMDDNLINFYSKQGCYYVLQYQILDITTIKYLAKMIIGDYSLPIKDSLELLGEVVLSLDTGHDFKQHEPTSAKIEKKQIQTPIKIYVKVAKPKSSSTVRESEVKLPTVKTKNTVKGNKVTNNEEKINEQSQNDTLKYEDKEQQYPEIDEDNIEIIYVEDSGKEVPPEPGEHNYVYENIPINPTFGCKLATIWESIDQPFMQNIKNFIFMTRCLRHEFLMYIDELRSTFVQLTKKPDEGSKLLKNFQKMYNSIDPAFRRDDEIKCELHYRIYEFKLKLLDIYTQKMRDIEQKRIEVVEQNYFSSYAISMIKTYTTLLQIELDRVQNIMQFLQEYYTVIITLKPNKEGLSKKMNVEEKDEGHYAEISNEINYILKNLVEENEVTSINNKINVLLEDSETVINHIETTHNKIASTLENQYFPSKNKSPTKNNASNENKEESNSQKSQDVLKKLFYEWYKHIEGGMVFTRNRSRITCEYLKDLLYKCLSYNILYHQEIKQQYIERLDREQQNIETIVELFSLAVESEDPVSPEIDLLGDKLVVNPNVLIHETISNRIKPKYEKDVFALNKIEKLVDIFLATSATGTMPERAFIFLLRDIIINNAEDGSSPLFPVYWQELTSNNLNEISNEIFCNNQMINWKDFILWLINCFPTDKQLLEMKEKFKMVECSNDIVNKDDFYEINLIWLHDKYNDNELILLKNIFFKMYCLENTEHLLYMEMLLDFCKDSNGVLGYVKALELHLGMLVCVDVDTGKKLIAKCLEEKYAAQESIIKVTKIQEDEISINDVINETLQNVSNKKKRKSTSTPTINFSENFVSLSSDDDIWHIEQVKHQESVIYIYLSLEVMVIVLTASLYSTMNFELDRGVKLRSDLNDIYQHYKYYNFGKKVPCHQILNDHSLKDMIDSVYRFTSVNIKSIVDKILGKIDDLF